MNIDSLTWGRWCRDNAAVLQNTKIGQIRQAEDTLFILTVLTATGPQYLIIELQQPARCFLTAARPSGTHRQPGNFCMLLRKHLEGATLLRVEQVCGDRLLRFSFSRIAAGGKLAEKSLLLELLPNAANCILLEEHTVLDAWRRYPARDLLPNREYTLPAHSERMLWTDFNSAELADLLGATPTEPARAAFLRLFNGFSRPLLTAMADAAAADLETPFASWPQTVRAACLDYLAAARATCLDDLPVYRYRTGKRDFLTPLRLTEPVAETHPAANAALQAVQNETGAASVRLNELRRTVQRLLRKEARKAEKIAAEQAETAALEQYKRYGDLLAIHAHIDPGYAAEITLPDLLAETPTEVTIPIVAGETLVQNSQRYYKKYNRLKNRRSVAEQYYQAALAQRDYLESIAYFLAADPDPERVLQIEEELAPLLPKRKKTSPDRPKMQILTTEYDGYRIGIGRNNAQNEHLTMKLARPDDLWLHAKDVPGSHVVIFRQDGSDYTEEVIYYAATLAAGYSRAGSAPKAEVDYTLRRHVKKPNGAALGFVRYTDYRTILVPPQQLPHEKREH